MTVAENLKYLRMKKGLSLAEVSRAVGVTRSTIQKYESGDVDIKRTMAIKLANVYGVTPSQIMLWDDE